MMELEDARKSLQEVEEFLNSHYGFDIRITMDDDKLLHLWLVRKDEPCRY